MILALLLLALPAHAARAPAVLSLSVRDGRAPLTVKVIGPPVLLEKAKACGFGFAGFGFWVEWGDGSNPPVDHEHPDCGKMLEHTYTVPGEYTVKAQVGHPGPTDQFVTDWSGEDRVTVAGGKAPELGLELIEKPDGREFTWGASPPPFRLRVETGKPAELTAELVSESGRVLFTEKLKVTYSGEEALRFRDFLNGAPDDAYPAGGRLRVRLRLALTAGGKTVHRESGLFTLLASVSYREFTVKPGEGKAPLSVTAETRISYPECYSSVIDWGDGSEPERSAGFEPKKKCTLHGQPRRIPHVFRKPGRFRIRWYDNDTDPFHEAKIAPGYMEKTVTVR